MKTIIIWIIIIIGELFGFYFIYMILFIYLVFLFSFNFSFLRGKKKVNEKNLNKPQKRLKNFLSKDLLYTILPFTTKKGIGKGELHESSL